MEGTSWPLCKNDRLLGGGGERPCHTLRPAMKAKVGSWGSAKGQCLGVGVGRGGVRLRLRLRLCLISIRGCWRQDSNPTCLRKSKQAHRSAMEGCTLCYRQPRSLPYTIVTTKPCSHRLARRGTPCETYATSCAHNCQKQGSATNATHHHLTVRPHILMYPPLRSLTLRSLSGMPSISLVSMCGGTACHASSTAACSCCRVCSLCL